MRIVMMIIIMMIPKLNHRFCVAVQIASLFLCFIPMMMISAFNYSIDSFHCTANYYWLHIPKTSSTFCLTLQHRCCQERFETIIDGITPDQILENELLSKEEKSFSLNMKFGCVFIQHKTKGSSLTGCQFVKRSHHRPIPRNYNVQRHAVFVILREPRSRLISSFLDSHHHEGMSLADYKNLHKKMFPPDQNFTNDPRTGDFETFNITNGSYPAVSKKINSLDRLIYALKVYVHDPAIIGCQTKMILGYQCADGNFVLSRTVINETVLQAALTKLRDVYFVGIFEEYKTTLELFYEMTSNQNLSYPGPKLTPSIFELIQTRTGDHARASVLSKYLSDYRDPYDSVLYEEGRKIFEVAVSKKLRPLSLSSLLL